MNKEIAENKKRLGEEINERFYETLYGKPSFSYKGTVYQKIKFFRHSNNCKISSPYSRAKKFLKKLNNIKAKTFSTALGVWVVTWE